jgi:hypothetical protein
MTQITISDELRDQLFASSGVVQLCDSSGKPVADVTLREKPIPPGWMPMLPELTEEELKRRAAYDGPGITTGELLARLRAK